MGGRYSFPCIVPLYSQCVPYNADVLRKDVSITIFWLFSVTQPEIEPQSPEPLANTQPTRPIDQYYVFSPRMMVQQIKILTVLLPTQNICWRVKSCVETTKLLAWANERIMLQQCVIQRFSWIGYLRVWIQSFLLRGRLSYQGLRDQFSLLFHP